jgi:hypothetical protein
MAVDGHTFSIPDYIVFAAMLVVSAAIGVYYACAGGKQQSTREFLMANNSMRFLPLSLSGEWVLCFYHRRHRLHHRCICRRHRHHFHVVSIVVIIIIFHVVTVFIITMVGSRAGLIQEI